MNRIHLYHHNKGRIWPARSTSRKTSFYNHYVLLSSLSEYSIENYEDAWAILLFISILLQWMHSHTHSNMLFKDKWMWTKEMAQTTSTHVKGQVWPYMSVTPALRETRDKGMTSLLGTLAMGSVKRKKVESDMTKHLTSFSGLWT